MSKLSKAFIRFRSDNGGVVLVTFAFAIVFLMLAIGVAVDFGNAHSSKTSFQNAADAAALAVVRAGADDDSLSIGALKQLGKDFFDSQIRSQERLSELSQIDVNPVRVNGSVRATVSFSADVKNLFGGLFKISTTNVAGTAVAEVSFGALDVHIALDISDSMGLGASEDDQKRLKDEIGCVFACHTTEGTPGEPTLETAKQLGIRLRLDVLKTASLNLINQMQSDLANSELRLAVYSFHNTASEKHALNSYLNVAKDEIEKLELADNLPISIATGSEKQPGETLPREIANLLESSVISSSNGTGTKRVVVLITDGVKTIRPYFEGGYAGLYSSPFEPDMCDSLKNAGVDVAVIQIIYNYYGKETSPSYDAIEYFENEIGPNLEACASPGLFFSGDQPEEIERAMADFWSSYKTSALRLTH